MEGRDERGLSRPLEVEAGMLDHQMTNGGMKSRFEGFLPRVCAWNRKGARKMKEAVGGLRDLKGERPSIYCTEIPKTTRLTESC